MVHPACVILVFMSRTLWGNGFGECTTCREDDDPAWLCPAALSAYYDLGGTSDDIIEFDGGEGKWYWVSNSVKTTWA